MRVAQMLRDALGPFTADLYPLVIPDTVAARVHVAQHLHHGLGIRMGIADEYVRLSTFIGLEIIHCVSTSVSFPI